MVTNKMTFVNSLKKAINQSWSQIIYNIDSFKLILRPATGAYKQVKSPIGIARMLPNEWNWEFIWSFTALFSIGLAFMNLLPIPALDGGHVMFLSYEIISRRKPSDKFLETAQKVGMVFLLALMVFIFANDIIKLF